MPEQITLLRVFVASPRDVANERSVLENVVRELNTILLKTLKIQLDLIKWETHAYPSIGEDAQGVINEQIGDAYDIFIGILWKRFGTPTLHATSGTAEEFERAYRRHKEQPANLRVLFYFNELPVAPSEINPEQLANIQKFRASLGPKGVLYWTYNDADEFAKLVRLHLHQHIADYGKTWGTAVETRVDANAIEGAPPLDFARIDLEEAGFIDLVELSTEAFTSVTEVTNRMAKLTQELGGKIQTAAQEMAALTRPLDVNQAKRISNRAAGELEMFSTRIQAEVPIFMERHSAAISAYVRAAELSLGFGQESRTQINEALVVVKGLKASLAKSISQVRDLSVSILGTPPLTTRFNRAKRQATAMISRVSKEMESALNLTTEAEKAMLKLLSE